MADTMEQNTRWVEVWAVNDYDHLPALQVAAQEGPDALRECVREIWTTAPEGSGPWHQGQNMSPADYDNTDWPEIVDTVLSVEL